MATIKKRLPYELYDVAGLEDWFARMAAEGYHLVDCNQNRAEFTVATPKENVRYRLEAVETYQYDWNKDRAYEAMGWYHVATIIGFFYIFQCDDPVIPELHTDPTIQSWTMKKLIRRQWFALIWIPLYWLFMLRDSIGRLFTAPYMAALDMICSSVLLGVYAVMIFVMVYIFACQAVQLSALRKLKQRLASGLPMDRSKRYPRSFWRHGFMWVMMVLVFGGLFGAVMAENKKVRSDFPLEDYPHVTLEELLPGQTVALGPKDEMRYWMGQQMETSLLAPVQLRFGDAGRLKSDESPVRIHMYYYETRSPDMARVILKGKMEELEQSLDIERSWHENHPDEFPAIVLDTGPVLTAREGWDELWIWDTQRSRSTEPTRDYFGRIGDKVFALYVILPEPEMALDLLAEKVGGNK